MANPEARLWRPSLSPVPSYTRPDMTVATLLDIAQQLMFELHPHKANTMSVTLDSSLERDLGLDSLGRMELLERMERAFDVRLPEQLLAAAETLRDLLRAVPDASTTRILEHKPRVMSQALEQIDTSPPPVQTLVEVLDWHRQTHPQRPHIHLYGD